MAIPDEPSLGRPIASARELLQRFHYGHGDHVEKILEFASSRRLMDDDLVFLLVSILKGNEELVRCILLAIDGTERVIDNSRAAGQDLRALEQQLTAQMEAAANRSAGWLNVAADRLARTANRVDALCGGIDAAARSLTQAEGAFARAAELGDGKRTIDALVESIRRQALADLRGYHAEIASGLEQQVSRKSGWLHFYGAIGTLLTAVLLLRSVF